MADDTDATLLARLRAELDAGDPVPEALRSAARGALTWLTVDAELAALAEDSLLSSAGVRGHPARSLTFECSAGMLTFEISGDGDSDRRVVGQCDRPATLTVRHGGGPISVDTDEYGRFRIEHVAAGPMSLHCVFGDSPDHPLVTSWVVV